jgi:hypothetical protein
MSIDIEGNWIKVTEALPGIGAKSILVKLKTGTVKYYQSDCPTLTGK